MGRTQESPRRRAFFTAVYVLLGLNAVWSAIESARSDELGRLIVWSLIAAALLGGTLGLLYQSRNDS